ncbi:MAG: NUDIX hydrolase [Candidatus Saccharimonadales bacterium]
MPHIHEKIDFTIVALLVFNGKVLLVNHPRYDFWLGPGGHIELDEDPDQTLFREIKEETGYRPDEIEILSSRPKQLESKAKFLYTPNYMDIHEANAPHKHIALYYFARVRHGNHVKSDEHSDARWLAVDELDNPKFKIPPDTRLCAKEAIKLASNINA